jgi:hypothetical protein
MKNSSSIHSRLLTPLLVGVAMLASAEPGSAQTVSGRASAVKATTSTLFGSTTTAIADTGPLSDATDARQASQGTAAVSSLMTGDALHATTIGWPDQVASESSAADVALSIAGNAIGADFVMSRARAVQGAPASGATSVEGLSVNGVPIPITGAANQTVWIAGGRVVINEQQISATGATVNALHVVVDGVADVVIASATADVR